MNWYSFYVILLPTMTLSSTIARNNPYTKLVNACSERVTKVVLEWNIPQEVKKVSVVPLLTNLLTRAKTVGTVMFLDTKLEEFDLEDLDAMQPEDLTNRFMAESVKVKDGSKVLLGMSIRSTSTLEEVNNNSSMPTMPGFCFAITWRR